jgi:hypothetical protein
MRSASTAGVATWGSAADLTVRGTSTSVTTARGSSAKVTVRRAPTSAATRMASFMDVITRYRMRVRMPTNSGRAVTLATGSTTASTVEATMVLGPTTSAGASVMRYIVRGASTRTTSPRGNNSPSRELARSRSRGHRGPAVIERRMQLSVSESRVLVITL